MVLAKHDMEEMARSLRSSLGLKDTDPLDPFRIRITGVKIVGLREVPDLDPETVDFLLNEGSSGWSAMSVPVDEQQEQWVVVVNDAHESPRRRVSLLEELWHISQGHKLTSVVRIGSTYGRTFETEDEHDAFYLAAATLLPDTVVRQMVQKKTAADVIAGRFGVSVELVEYRIKRLGLWNQYKGKQISFAGGS